MNFIKSLKANKDKLLFFSILFSGFFILLCNVFSFDLVENIFRLPLFFGYLFAALIVGYKKIKIKNLGDYSLLALVIFHGMFTLDIKNILIISFLAVFIIESLKHVGLLQVLFSSAEYQIKFFLIYKLIFRHISTGQAIIINLIIYFLMVFAYFLLDYSFDFLKGKRLKFRDVFIKVFLHNKNIFSIAIIANVPNIFILYLLQYFKLTDSYTIFLISTFFSLSILILINHYLSVSQDKNNLTAILYNLKKVFSYSLDESANKNIYENISYRIQKSLGFEYIAIFFLNSEGKFFQKAMETDNSLIEKGLFFNQNSFSESEYYRLRDNSSLRKSNNVNFFIDIQENDTVRDNIFSSWKYDNFITIDLINSKGNIYGFLLLSHPENNENPSKEIFETAEFFSNVYSVVFENYINYFKIRNLAIYDELTGLFNFRYFSFRLKDELRRCERYDRPLSLIMIDIDHFKKYNDQNGHDNGNLVLRKAAELMKKATREVDFVCRYGGEEFSIILPETGHKDAVMVGDRVRTIIEEFVFPYQENQPSGNLTISMGLAEYPAEATNFQELIKAADKKLYRAKESGRNRLIF